MDDKLKKVVSSIVKDFLKKNKRDPKDLKELVLFVLSLGGKKYIERKTQEVLGKQPKEQPQEQTTEQKLRALHGAKLNYFKSLKHQCAEDEEIVYYKKGGSVGCGCKKKMEEGGQTPKKKNNAIDRFKNRKQDLATKDSIAVNNYGAEDIEATRPGTYKKNKEGKVQWTPDRTKAPYNKTPKKACGSKIKKHQEGSVIAKFKAYRKGGSLNGIPFIQKGTPKGGLPTAPKAKDRFKNGVRDSVAYLGVPGKDESYFGESIRRVTTPDNAKIQLLVLFRHYPNNNDTIYTEVPEHKERLLFLPPVNIKSRKAFNYIKGPEYEILKRRFNTAWNLAK